MPAPTFCDDFDYGALGDHWLDFEKVNGDYQVNSAVSISPPKSLFSNVNSIAATDDVRAVVKTAFPQFAGTRGVLDMSFDLYVDQIDPKPGARIIAFALLYGDTSKFYELVLNLNSTGSGASGIVTENTYPEGLYEEHGYLGATHAKWVNVRIEVTVKNPTGVGNPLGVYFDGQRTNGPTDELKAPLIGGNPRVEVGIGWMDTTKGTGGGPPATRTSSSIGLHNNRRTPFAYSLHGPQLVPPHHRPLRDLRRDRLRRHGHRAPGAAAWGRSGFRAPSR